MIRRERWKHSLKNQHLPQSYAMRQVDGEDIDSYSPDRCATNKHGSVPLEMVFPFVLSWMKQPHDLTYLGIYSRNVWPLVVVAGKTCQREVA